MNTMNLNKLSATVIFLVLVVFAANAHLPGSTYIYKCPFCSTLIKNGSNLTGNTIGAALFSDGKMIAPMLPEFPNLTKCKKCNFIFWLRDLEPIGSCRNEYTSCKYEWLTANKAEFLGIKDLFRALKLDSVDNNKAKELDVRQRIWRAFNDRIRNNKGEIFNNNEDGEEDLWKQNCLKLIDLFDVSDINQKIMKAELHRNLGEFEACIELLNSIDANNYDYVKDKIKAECEKKNKWLIRLN
jgi:hypothetical protein